MTSRRPAPPRRSAPRRSFQARPLPRQNEARQDGARQDGTRRGRAYAQSESDSSGHSASEDSLSCPCCGTDAHLQALEQRYGKRSLPSYGDLVNDWLGRSPKTRQGKRLTAPPRDPVGLGCVALGGMVGAAAIGTSLPVLGVAAGVTAYARHRVVKRYNRVYAPEYRKWARSLYCERCDLVFQPSER
ncbi:MAG: hypothetical protein ACFB4J_12830 [Elainellaceae cyanobacterium]